MLRLVLDALESHRGSVGPLKFLPESHWYSEALLDSPFRPRKYGDPLGEGKTNVDGVVGQFGFRDSTRAGFALDSDARQFVVLEAKMFSNLSTGTPRAKSSSVGWREQRNPCVREIGSTPRCL